MIDIIEIQILQDGWSKLSDATEADSQIQLCADQALRSADLGGNLWLSPISGCHPQANAIYADFGTSPTLSEALRATLDLQGSPIGFFVRSKFTLPWQASNILTHLSPPKLVASSFQPYLSHSRGLSMRTQRNAQDWASSVGPWRKWRRWVDVGSGIKDPISIPRILV